jgi:hypothetical protein
MHGANGRWRIGEGRDMDSTMRMTTRMAMAAVVLVLLLPASAFAKDTLSHTTTTTRVSGAQIAEQMLGQVKRVNSVPPARR